MVNRINVSYLDMTTPADPNPVVTGWHLLLAAVSLAALLCCGGCCLLAMGDRPPQEWLKEQWNAPIPPDTRPLAPSKDYK